MFAPCAEAASSRPAAKKIVEPEFLRPLCFYFGGAEPTRESAKMLRFAAARPSSCAFRAASGVTGGAAAAACVRVRRPMLVMRFATVQSPPPRNTPPTMLERVRRVVMTRNGGLASAVIISLLVTRLGCAFLGALCTYRRTHTQRADAKRRRHDAHVHPPRLFHRGRGWFCYGRDHDVGAGRLVVRRARGHDD